MWLYDLHGIDHLCCVLQEEFTPLLKMLYKKEVQRAFVHVTCPPYALMLEITRASATKIGLGLKPVVTANTGCSPI